MGKTRTAAESAGPLRIRTLAAGAATGFSVHRISMRGGASHPALHHARTCEFFLVTRGGAQAMIGGVRRRLRPGDHVSLAPGTVHGFRAGPQGVEVLAVFRPPLDLSRPDIVLEEGPDASS